MASGQTVLTNGWPNPGSINTPSETDTWSFPAAAGDTIVIQISELSGGAAFTPRIEAFAPDGATLGHAAGATAARLNLHAPVAGVYTVTAGDTAQSGTGTYTLQFAKVPGVFSVPSTDQGGPLTNGVSHGGTIDVGDLDAWTINLGAGDRLSLQIAEASGGAGFASAIEVFAPNGQRLGTSSGATAARIDLQAQVAGAYTVLVSDAGQSGSGTYQLTAAHVPGVFVVPAGDDGGALLDNQDTEGTISPGDLDQWTFAASAGELITLQITELSGGANFAPMIELFTPAAERKVFSSSATAATLDSVIDAAGAYRVLVSDANQIGSGTYRLRLIRQTITAPGPNILTNGATALGSIAAAGESNTWTFMASSGESIIVRMGETATVGLLPWLRMYGPDGVLLDQNFNAAAAEVAIRATNSGTFSVVAADGSAGRNQTGNYRIGLTKTGGPLVVSSGDEGGALTNGATYLAAIETGEIDAWTFTANAGETMIVRAGETTASSPLLPWLRLYGPNGVLLSQNFNAAAAEVVARATNSGRFLVVVGDGNAAMGGAGNYRLSLAKTASELTISASDEGGILTNGTTYLATSDIGDIDAWTFAANAGESIIVRAGEMAAASSLTPWLRLFGPNGALLDESFGAAAAEVVARVTNSGMFTVVLGDGTSGIGGSGNYRISLAKTGRPLAISENDEGAGLVNGSTYLATIDTGDIDAWAVSANAGDAIVVRAGEVTAGSGLSPWLRMYGPNGVLLSAGFVAGAAEVITRATNSGVFLVLMGDGSSGMGNSGHYRISVAKTGSPLSISPGDEGGTLTNGATHLAAVDTGDIDAWVFTANAGDSFIVRAGETSATGLAPWLRVYTPSGVLLGQSFNAAAAEVTVQTTNGGTFTVVLGDGNASIAGTGNYRITVVRSGEPLIISPNDEGGLMSGGSAYDGTIDVGDVDGWTFTACAGDIISVSVTELAVNGPLSPWVRLHGPDGAQLRSIFAAATAQFSYVATAGGAYTLTVSDGTASLGGSGTYRLTVNGLSAGLKLCPPRVVGTNVNVVGIGGTPGTAYTLFTATNVVLPLAQWSPVSNLFNAFGVFSYTNVFNTAEPQRFFYLRMP